MSPKKTVEKAVKEGQAGLAEAVAGRPVVARRAEAAQRLVRVHAADAVPTIVGSK